MVSMRWRKEPPSPDLPDHDSNEPLSTEELATLDHGLGASHHAYPTPSANPSRDQLASNNKTPHTIYSVPNASGSLTVNSLLSVKAPETVTKRKSQNSLAKSFRRVSSAVSLSKDKSNEKLNSSATGSEASLSSPTTASGSRSNLEGVPEKKQPRTTSRNNSQVNIPPVPVASETASVNGFLNPNPQPNTIYHTTSNSSNISPNTSTPNIPTIIHPQDTQQATSTSSSGIHPSRSNMSSHSAISATESVDSFQSVTQDFSEVVLVPTEKHTAAKSAASAASAANSAANSPLPTSASQFAKTSPVKGQGQGQGQGFQNQGFQNQGFQNQSQGQGQNHGFQHQHQGQGFQNQSQNQGQGFQNQGQTQSQGHGQDFQNQVQNQIPETDDDSVSVDSPVDDDPTQQAVESVQSRVGENQQGRRDVQQPIQSSAPSFAQSLSQSHAQAIPTRSANKEFVSSVAPPSATMSGSSSRPSLAAAMRGGISDTPAIPMAAATTAVSSMSPKSQNSMTESVSALSSPASSMIFERNVQEFSVAATSAGASSSKIWHNHDNTHYHGEDRVAPALDASTEAIINSKVNPEDIDVISLRRPSSIRARSPTEASLNSLWSPGSPTMLQDGSSGAPRTRNNSMSVHPLTASHTGGSLSPDKLNGGDGRQVLSFCSFADVVHTENEETTASSDRLGRFDTRSQSALRSPSPLMRQHHPVSPSMAESVVADLKLTIPPSRSATVDSVDSESPIVVSSFGETIRRRTSELGL